MTYICPNIFYLWYIIHLYISYPIFISIISHNDDVKPTDSPQRNCETLQAITKQAAGMSVKEGDLYRFQAFQRVMVVPPSSLDGL